MTLHALRLRRHAGMSAVRTTACRILTQFCSFYGTFLIFTHLRVQVISRRRALWQTVDASVRRLALLSPLTGGDSGILVCGLQSRGVTSYPVVAGHGGLGARILWAGTKSGDKRSETAFCGRPQPGLRSRSRLSGEGGACHPCMGWKNRRPETVCSPHSPFRRIAQMSPLTH